MHCPTPRIAWLKRRLVEPHVYRFPWYTISSLCNSDHRNLIDGRVSNAMPDKSRYFSRLDCHKSRAFWHRSHCSINPSRKYTQFPTSQSLALIVESHSFSPKSMSQPMQDTPWSISPLSLLKHGKAINRDIDPSSSIVWWCSCGFSLLSGQC